LDKSFEGFREVLDRRASAHPFENVQSLLPVTSWLGAYPVPGNFVIHSPTILHIRNPKKELFCGMFFWGFPFVFSNMFLKCFGASMTQPCYILLPKISFASLSLEENCI
jgi:hypothetical protein